MSTRIRLARGGSKKRPFYRIVVANARAPRDGDFIEKVGIYHPLLATEHEQRVSLVEERINYWLNQGAQPSEKVITFIEKANIPLPAKMKKQVELKKAARRPKEAKKKS